MQTSNEGGVFPAFVVSAFNVEDDPEAVDLVIHTPSNPDIKKHASMGLMYGLAIMILDRDNVISDKVNELLESGPINEVDATNRITVLLDEQVNELPV